MNPGSLRRSPQLRVVLLVSSCVFLLLILPGCSPDPPSRGLVIPTTAARNAASAPTAPSGSASENASSTRPAARFGLPGMPAPLSPNDIWSADRPGALSSAVAGDPARVYVPNSLSDTVTVIDPATYRVLATVKVGHEPQHVVPSWDLKTLWVNNDLGNSLTPIDPRTGRFGRAVPVHDPYNLYFTPDGRSAVVMASADQQIVFRDPRTLALQQAVPAGCAGVNHADFSADGRFFIVSCEFSGVLLKVTTDTHRIVARLRLPARAGRKAKPQDVKLSSDGQVFYVADMKADGVWLVDGTRPAVTGFIHTGSGAHGLYVTRDSRRLLITNRDEGSISVLDLASRRLVAKWRIPGHASPDMGGLSADGRVFWVSGRSSHEVYAISALDGHLIRRIRVGVGPHGLCVFPQPGRYSLGHTGVFR